MKIELDPETWSVPPGAYELDGHVDAMAESTSTNRLDFFETDVGWFVEVTHRTAGACNAISQRFQLPPAISDALAEIHCDSEERIIWRTGFGAQVTIDGAGAR